MSFKNARFDTYIYRVLGQVHPTNGMSGDGLSTMNNLDRIVLQRLVTAANRVMVATAGRKTMGTREIQTAVRLTFPGELSKHAISEGTKAVVKYNTSKSERVKGTAGTKAKPQSRSKLAGIVFPVTRVENIMEELSNSERKKETTAVYLAAVLEYVTAEVLELAGNAARDNKKVRITPRHITLAIRNDQELNKLFQGVILSGGVIPHIESSLIKTKPEKEEGAPKKKRVVKKKPEAKAGKKAGGAKKK
jgi:histone H2A